MEVIGDGGTGDCGEETELDVVTWRTGETAEDGAAGGGVTSNSPSVRRQAAAWAGSGTLSNAWSLESDGSRWLIRSLLS